LHTIHLTDRVPCGENDRPSKDHTPHQMMSELLANLLGSVIMSDAVTSQLVVAIRDSGHAIVPVLPTKEMVEAAWADALNEDAAGVWSSMIASALQIKKSD
jgi:hypothetical protein